MALLNLLFLLITTVTVNVKKVMGVDVLSIARLHSNPTIQWYTNMSDSVVRIRLIGPADRWFAIGIGNTSMDNTYTFVVYGDGTVSERRLGFHNAGYPLPTQETDLNITFVKEDNGIREIEISRARVGYSNLFYTFPNSRLSSVALIAAWSMSAGDSFGHYHGEKNRLYDSIDFSLSNETTPDPTNAPTRAPTQAPTLTPTNSPTLTPSISPTLTPTASPTQDFRNRYDLYGMATLGGQNLDNIQLVVGIEYATNTVFINITGPTATWFAVGFGSDYIYDTPSSSMKGKYAIIIDWTREGNGFSVIDDQHILEYFLDDHYVNIQQPLNKFVQRKIQQHPDQTERFRRNVLMQRPTFKVNDSNGEYFNFSTCNKKYKIIWARGQYSPYKANAFGGGAGHTATDRGSGSITVQGALFDDCNSVKSLFDKKNIISIIVITVYAIGNM